jgi:phosphoenolpyruvate-protein kinase (PTS system EI component)
LDLKKSQVSGIVCENAGPTSHAAILCRAFGIPAVEGIKNIIEELPQDRFAMIDGASGCIGTANSRKELLPLFRNRSKPGVVKTNTIDLSKITLMANLNFARNAITALAAGAQGIGLYRTEFEFMVANRLLTEEEQFVRYCKVVTAMMGLPVTIRLIDIAADKSPEILSSFGGNIDSSCSGALFLLSRPGLFKTQARAIARAAAFGPVRVLYPMVADAGQFLCLKKVFCDAAAGKALPALLHGAMIEQPSAVDDAGRIFESADFACLGTNDLTKHLLHVDRDTAIAHGAEVVGSSTLWDAFGKVASVASTRNKELTVCGEMASDVLLLPRFTELGIKIFSMDIRTIRRLRKGTANPASDEPDRAAA